MLPMNRLFNVMKRTIQEYGKDDGGNLAAALAFSAFFSLFPLVLFLISLASLFVNEQTAQQWVLQNVPNVGSASGQANVLLTTVTQVLEAKKSGGTWVATIVGLVGLLFSASNVFGTLETAINRAWGCEKAGSLIKDKVIAFLLVLGAAMVLLANTIIASLLNGIQQGTNGIIGAFPWLWQIVNILVAVALMTGVLTVIYRTLPRCKVEWADVWPGGLFAAILLQVLQQLFGYYLGHFTNYAAVYGALGGVIALQTLILFICMILMLGAEFCSEYAKERQGIEADRARTANAASERQRKVTARARVEERSAARRQGPELIPAPPGPPGAASPREAATVLTAAAALAAAIGLVGRALTGGRGGR